MLDQFMEMISWVGAPLAKHPRRSILLMVGTVFIAAFTPAVTALLALMLMLVIMYGRD